MRSSRAAIPAALLFLSGAAGLHWWTATGSHAAPEGERERLEIVTETGTKVFTVEVARTPVEQARGLMYRTRLDDDAGMLFPHEAPREATMWMRNTYISLDMLFIRSDGVIHRIEARTEPLSETIIPSRGPVSAVLELAAGAAERHGIRAGDLVRHPAFPHPGK